MTEKNKKFRGLEILIVEDDLSFQELLQMRLKGFFPESQFTSFTTMREAQPALKGLVKKPDLVILDHNLPDGNGTKLLEEGLLRDVPVLIISSDEAPEIPGASLGAGAAFFLSKSQITDALLRPLLEAMLERSKLHSELQKALIDSTVVNTVRTLITTLRHEINNPLGAVIGAAHLISYAKDASEEQKTAAHLVHQSGMRIKEVLDRLAEATSHQSMEQAKTTVFKIPGDETA